MLYSMKCQKKMINEKEQEFWGQEQQFSLGDQGQNQFFRVQFE